MPVHIQVHQVQPALLHLIALPMIVPALSIEGTDAFDAIQRCYAYVIGRPIRYFLYAILLTLVG